MFENNFIKFLLFKLDFGIVFLSTVVHKHEIWITSKLELKHISSSTFFVTFLNVTAYLVEFQEFSIEWILTKKSLRD